MKKFRYIFYRVYGLGVDPFRVKVLEYRGELDPEWLMKEVFDKLPHEATIIIEKKLMHAQEAIHREIISLYKQGAITPFGYSCLSDLFPDEKIKEVLDDE